MAERTAVLDDATFKVGMLMESAEAHQKLAEAQLERLRAHTQDLDEVVRDQIRRTLVDELQLLTAETTRATRALQKMRTRVAVGGVLRSVAAALLCTLIPIAIARWAMPSPSDLESLRARRDELAANLEKLEQQGGRIDWRRCGEKRRLCVRVDRHAPTYGERADYFVLEGY